MNPQPLPMGPAAADLEVTGPITLHLHAELRAARQTVFHCAEYPSRLVLPVIPS